VRYAATRVSRRARLVSDLAAAAAAAAVDSPRELTSAEKGIDFINTQ